MRVTVWGVRGSIATSGPQFAATGGNTTCLEVESDGRRLIVDAGTGARALGNKLLAEARREGGTPDAAFLFTHLHWDHIQGFPFFAPAFVVGARMQLHGPGDLDGGVTLEAALARQMSPPTFPVALSDMPACKSFHTLADGDAFELEGFVVHVRALCHPQGSLGFRIERNGQAICFATDTEHPDDGSVDEALLELARGVDLLICDAQYTDAQYEGRRGHGPSRRGWGHSTYGAATRAAGAACAERLLLTHHDPSHDDHRIAAIERDAQRLFTPCQAAREQQPLQL